MMGSTANDGAEDATKEGNPADASGDGEPVVLVVDDEKRVTQAFALWLDGYDVRRATSGEEALERIDEDVDVVLLDRQMPGLSGSEVLARIREEGYDCRVAMVTGVDPDFEIFEMPFDDYLTKPVDQEELRQTVEELVRLADYGDRVHELFALANKQASLADRKSDGDLTDSEAYQRLLEELAAMQADLDAVMERLDPEAYERLFRDLPDIEGDDDPT